MWGSFQKFASKAMSVLPSKDEIMREVEKVKVLADLDSLKSSPQVLMESQRKRHARDLCVTYATDRILLMGQPYKGRRTRNGKVNAESAAAFLTKHYEGKFMLWNLGKANVYDTDKFNNQVRSNMLLKIV